MESPSSDLGLRIFSRLVSLVGLALIFGGVYFGSWFAGLGIVILFTSVLIYMPFVALRDERSNPVAVRSVRSVPDISECCTPNLTRPESLPVERPNTVVRHG